MNSMAVCPVCAGSYFPSRLHVPGSAGCRPQPLSCRCADPTFDGLGECTTCRRPVLPRERRAELLARRTVGAVR